jgi:hypothetical protein
MDVDSIIEIALENQLSDLCLKYYLEPHPQIKNHIYENEILPLYKKINKIQ